MLSYKAKKYINKQTSIFGSLAFVGLVVFILGTFFNILRDEMLGICIGFIPTGVIGVIITQRMKNNPEKTEKMITIETEERLQLIRYKTGNCAFWVTFICISVATTLSRYISISLPIFLSITLIAMVLIRVIASIVCHKIS